MKEKTEAIRWGKGEESCVKERVDLVGSEPLSLPASAGSTVTRVLLRFPTHPKQGTG